MELGGLFLCVLLEDLQRLRGEEGDVRGYLAEGILRLVQYSNKIHVYCDVLFVTNIY